MLYFFVIRQHLEGTVGLCRDVSGIDVVFGEAHMDDRLKHTSYMVFFKKQIAQYPAVQTYVINSRYK